MDKPTDILRHVITDYFRLASVGSFAWESDYANEIEGACEAIDMEFARLRGAIDALRRDLDALRDVPRGNE